MRKKALSFIILSILCFAIIAQVSAQTATANVGVSVGNYFRYRVTFFWNSTDPSDSIPLDLLDGNTTEYLQATINTIDLTAVTISTIQHYLDGREVPSEQLTDVSTGNGNSVLLYASNLNAGSYLFPQVPQPPIINDTVSREYAGSSRQTNLVEYRQTNVDTPSGQSYVYRYVMLYFDRQTGILVEAYFEDVSSDKPNQTISRDVKLYETNAWTTSNTDGDGNGGGNGDGTTASWFTTEMLYIIIIVVVLVVAIASVLLFRRRKSKTKQP